MVEEDDVFLKIMNEKKDPDARCTENQFEEVMHFFEETAQTKQPFAAVDSPPVISFEEIEESFDVAVAEHIKLFAKEIYDHWKKRRIETGNQPLQLALKVRFNENTIRHHRTNFRSLKRAKKQMMAILTYASADARFVRFAKPAVGMHRVPKSCVDFAKSLRMLASLLALCAGVRLPGGKC